MTQRLSSALAAPEAYKAMLALENYVKSTKLERNLIELLMVSNFVEVFLAREGHLNKVGVNFLEKVQLPHLASIYGAMLAGVGYVLMGAGCL